MAAAAATLALVALTPGAAATVSQNPDVTDTRYQSILETVHPVAPGVTWRVIDRNDEIELINHSHEAVVVYGYPNSPKNVSYNGGPYARILANGTVQLNENSTAYYLNQSFFADPVNVPAATSLDGEPARWVTVSTTATYIWHDHRIHYTSPDVPAFIKARGVSHRQFVFDWYVPIKIGPQYGYLFGKLYWLPQKRFTFPAAATIALIVIVLASAAFVLTVRTRRRAHSAREAW
ncbi:MAG TPA: hypothetical protein VGG41_04000 [Solirubrobacteraceae bacterium]